MAIQGLSITVSTTATILSAITFSDNIKYNYEGQSLLIQNPSTTVTVYIGGSDVTSSIYGYQLLPLQSVTIDLSSNEHIYAAVASGTQVVNIIRRGV